MQNYFNDKKEHFTLIIQEDDEVTYGIEKECNINYCLENNIPCSNRYDGGGTIVHAKGCIGFNYIYSHNKYKDFISTIFVRDLYNYFKEKGLNVELNKNDILIDGYKVVSSAEINLKPDYRWCSCSVLISMNQNLNLINKVCLKPMIKIPKALNEFNITTEEMLNFINAWKGEKIYE